MVRLLALLLALVHMEPPASTAPSAEQKGWADSCGRRALFVAAQVAGLAVSKGAIDRAMNGRPHEVTLLELRRAALAVTLHTVPVRHRVNSPLWNRIPAILPIRLRNGRGHYVVAYGRDDGAVHVIDSRGIALISETSLRANWDGTALYAFAANDEADRFARVVQQRGRSGGVVLCAIASGAIAGLLCLSLILRHSLSRVVHARANPMLTVPTRQAVTLIELLVTISLIGLLVSLALPAVQRVREAARRATCANHMKQVGVAAQSFHSSHPTFPPGGIASRQAPQLPTGEVLSNFSAFVYLLPYLEQNATYNLVNLELGVGFGGTRDPLGTYAVQATAASHRIAVFLCPSDPAPARPGTSLRLNSGVGPFHDRQNSPDGGNGAFESRPLAARDFLDGLSHTVMLSEKLRGDCAFGAYNPVTDWFYTSRMAFEWTADQFLEVCSSSVAFPPPYECDAGQQWFYADRRYTWYTHGQEPNGSVPDCGLRAIRPVPGLFTARSFHSGGVNALTADGGVRFVSEHVERKVWRALGTRNGDETVSVSEW